MRWTSTRGGKPISPPCGRSTALSAPSKRRSPPPTCWIEREGNATDDEHRTGPDGRERRVPVGDPHAARCLPRPADDRPALHADTAHPALAAQRGTRLHGLREVRESDADRRLQT